MAEKFAQFISSSYLCHRRRVTGNAEERPASVTAAVRQYFGGGRMQGFSSSVRSFIYKCQVYLNADSLDL